MLADLDDLEGTRAVPTELELRKLAGIKTPERQAAEYRRLCAAEAAARAPRRAPTAAKPKGRPPQRGLQHLFERARRYHALLEAGEVRSLEDLGRAEGVTGLRISQILSLLQLAPEIIDAVDVPADDLPDGVTERRLREFARVRDQQEQMAAWTGLGSHLRQELAWPIPWSWASHHGFKAPQGLHYGAVEFTQPTFEHMVMS